MTQPAKVPDLVAEIERLRSRVAEVETEREEARKKRSRSLSVPSPDLVGGPDLSLQQKSGALCTTNMWGEERSDHGNIDQSREHACSKFESFQPSDLTDVATCSHRLPAVRQVAIGASEESELAKPRTQVLQRVVR